MFWSNCFTFCERFNWTIDAYLAQPLYGVMRLIAEASDRADRAEGVATAQSDYGDFGEAELRELLARAEEDA